MVHALVLTEEGYKAAAAAKKRVPEGNGQKERPLLNLISELNKITGGGWGHTQIKGEKTQFLTLDGLPILRYNNGRVTYNGNLLAGGYDPNLDRVPTAGEIAVKITRDPNIFDILAARSAQQVA